MVNKNKLKNISIVISLITLTTIIMSFMSSDKKDISSTPIQEDTTALKKEYYIADYRINPASKTISRIQMVGGVDWDGFDYFPDSTIYFDTTSLIFVSGQVDFKERFDGIDFETLTPISYKSGTFKDKNGIFTSGRYHYNKILSLNDLQKINNDIYIDADSNVVYLNQTKYPVSNWSSPVKPNSLNTLTLLVDDYFIDQTGLYNAADYKATKQLMTFGDSIPKYEIFNSYIRIGNQLYSRTKDDSYLLDQNPDSTKEYKLDYYGNIHYIITDGNRTYYFDTRYPSSTFTELTQLQGTDIGQYIGSHEGFLFLSSDYYSHKRMPFFLLFYNNKSDIYTNFSPSTPQQMKELYIENRQEKCMKLFDPSKYKDLINDLYIYDGILYSYESKPVAESFDVKNLHQIKNNLIASDFVTDNKYLLYAGQMGGYSTRNDSIVKQEYITDKVDFASLEILSTSILMDKNNIYVGRHPLEVIPRKELGIKLEVYK